MPPANLPRSIAHSGRWIPPRARPLIVLVPLQWLVVAVIAASAEHNGWLYYQGGDNSWYYTTAWNFAHGDLSPAVVGYGWPLLLTPLAAAFGLNFLAAVPALVLVQTAVLLPLLALCVFGIASRVGSRRFAWGASVLAILAPLLLIPGFESRYHDRWVDNFLPQYLGLGGLADFPSTVAIAASAYFALRAIDTRSDNDAILAGLLSAAAVGIKPANALFLAAPALALLAARNLRGTAAFLASAAPSALVLAIWKQRGLGTLPLFSLPEAHLAASMLVAPFRETPLAVALDPYLRVDLGELGRNFNELREFFYSSRLLQWLPLAGIVGVARSSRPKAILFAAWVLGFVVLKGATPEASIESGSFYRLIMPALPAYFLLCGAVALTVPQLGARLAKASPPPVPTPRHTIAAAALVAVAVPLVLVSALPGAPSGRTALIPSQGAYIPVDPSFEVRAEPVVNGVRLSWSEPESAGAFLHYRVFAVRSPETGAGVDGLECATLPPRPAQCFLRMKQLSNLYQRSTIVDPGPGTYQLRVGATVDSRAAPDADVFLLSEPVLVHTRRR